MLVAELVVFLWLKRAETVRMLPMLVPLLIVCQIVMPGTLGTFKAILFPEQGLIAEQQGGAGTGSGRIADIGPALDELVARAVLRSGLRHAPDQRHRRTRQRADPRRRVARHAARGRASSARSACSGSTCAPSGCWRGRRRPTTATSSWLTTALAASITAFAVGMLTFDAFSFIQVTFLSFVLLGMGAVALRLGPQRTTASTQ